MKGIFPLLLCAFCVYAGIFIYKSSFVIGDERYYCLTDDAMISMSYARSLASGHGLVWTPGSDRVEGFTNPLWTLFMAGLHLLPIAPSKLSLPIQIAGGLFLALNILVVRRIAEQVCGGSSLAVFGAVLLTAFYFPLNNWGLIGVEVSLLALLVSMSLLAALRSMECGSASALPYALLGLGTLVRIDMAVPCVCLALALAYFDVTNRKRHLLLATGCLVLPLGLQTLWRLSYYGELLPNTYYLKMTGFPLFWRVAHGMYVTGEFINRLNGVFLVLLIGAVLGVRDRRRGILWAVVGGQLAYSIFVGGDAWEWLGGSNRYVALGIAPLFVLYAGTVERVVKTFEERRHRGDTDRGPTARHVGLTGSVLALSLLAVNAAGDRGSLMAAALVSPCPSALENQDRTRIGLLIREITTEDARIAVVCAGATPYFMERRGIDLLGKSDRVIAHQPMHLPPEGAGLFERLNFFWPGHLKWDYPYSIATFEPDIVTEVWTQIPGTPPYELVGYERVRLRGLSLYVRLGSPRIHWDLVGQLRAAQK